MDLRNSYLMNDLRGALATGMVCPTDRQMISLRVLPDEFVQPFEALRSKASDAIESTNAILQLWLEKGRRANRFSEEYIKVSRRIEKMVTTLGRGLITLHMQGEDLSKAPVSIEDLLDIASFHFNKSCNGAKAAAQTNPQVFERLMLNQLRWVNMLLRLERTRDRLNEKVIPGTMLPAAGPKTEKLPAGKAFKAIEGVAPVSGLGAVKALKPLVRFEAGGQQSADRGQQSADRGQQSADRGQQSAGSSHEVSEHNSEDRIQDPGFRIQDSAGSRQRSEGSSHEVSEHQFETLKKDEGNDSDKEAGSKADGEKDTLKKANKEICKEQVNGKSEEPELRLKNTEDNNDSKIKETDSKLLTKSKEIIKNNNYDKEKPVNENTLKISEENKKTKQEIITNNNELILTNSEEDNQKFLPDFHQTGSHNTLKNNIFDFIRNSPKVKEDEKRPVLTNYKRIDPFIYKISDRDCMDDFDPDEDVPP